MTGPFAAIHIALPAQLESLSQGEIDALLDRLSVKSKSLGDRLRKFCFFILISTLALSLRLVSPSHTLTFQGVSISDIAQINIVIFCIIIFLTLMLAWIARELAVVEATIETTCIYKNKKAATLLSYSMRGTSLDDFERSIRNGIGNPIIEVNYRTASILDRIFIIAIMPILFFPLFINVCFMLSHPFVHLSYNWALNVFGWMLVAIQFLAMPYAGMHVAMYGTPKVKNN